MFSVYSHTAPNMIRANMIMMFIMMLRLSGRVIGTSVPSSVLTPAKNVCGAICHTMDKSVLSNECIIQRLACELSFVPATKPLPVDVKTSPTWRRSEDICCLFL